MPDADAWNARYEIGSIPWDLGRAHPELETRLALDPALVPVGEGSLSADEVRDRSGREPHRRVGGAVVQKHPAVGLGEPVLVVLVHDHAAREDDVRHLADLLQTDSGPSARNSANRSGLTISAACTSAAPSGPQSATTAPIRRSARARATRSGSISTPSTGSPGTRSRRRSAHSRVVWGSAP